MKPALSTALLLLVACGGARWTGLAPVGDDGDAVRPELRWTAFPAGPESGIEALEYELQVADLRTGERIYLRRGIPQCVHRVEEDLPQGRELGWTVRARYRRNGSLRLTPWTGPEGSDRDGDVTRAAGVPLNGGRTSAGPGSPRPGSASPRP